MKIHTYAIELSIEQKFRDRICLCRKVTNFLINIISCYERIILVQSWTHGDNNETNRTAEQ